MARTTERPRGAPVAVAAALHGGVLPERSRSNNRAVHERHRGLADQPAFPSASAVPYADRNPDECALIVSNHGASRVQRCFRALSNTR
jgi:hypothetical protein